VADRLSSVLLLVIFFFDVFHHEIESWWLRVENLLAVCVHLPGLGHYSHLVGNYCVHVTQGEEKTTGELILVVDP